MQVIPGFTCARLGARGCLRATKEAPFVRDFVREYAAIVIDPEALPMIAKNALTKASPNAAERLYAYHRVADLIAGLADTGDWVAADLLDILESDIDDPGWSD